MQPEESGQYVDANERLRTHISGSFQKCYVLPIATRCNARCVFCATTEYHPAVSSEVMEISNLGSVLDTLMDGGASRFEVTGGGEPTIHPALAQIIAMIRSRGARLIKLYTNGVRLKPGLEIDQLNISRASLNDEKNNAIMRFTGSVPTFGEIVDRARRAGYTEIRASVPLIKGGVDSEPAARELLIGARGLVDGVVFRPLYPATPHRAALLPTLDAVEWQAIIMGLAEEFVDDLNVELDSDGCFRSLQTILASDLCVYGDWSLSDRIHFAK